MQRPPRPPRPHDAQRPPRASGPSTHAASHASHASHAHAAPDSAPLPDDPARRERALLLRTWESSPLTPANFCALKGLKVAEFETQIELARRERAERGERGERGGAPRRG